MDHDDAALETLRRERDDARAYARSVEHELGRARGQVRRLERALWRRTAARRRWHSLWQRLRAGRGR